MILPLVLIFGLGLAAYHLGRTPASPKQVVGSAYRAGQVRVYPRGPAGRPGSESGYVLQLQAVLRRGQAPTKFLFNEALREAYSAGRPDLVVKILALRAPVNAAVPAQPSPEAPDTSGTPASEAPEPLVPTTPVAQTLELYPSPFEDVEGPDWTDFVKALQVGQSQNGRYVGPFQHNRDRLEERGLDPAGDPYGNFRADIQALDDENLQLVRDFAGEVVDIDGVPTPITRSGILALLKAAGPDGAYSWLTEPGDHKAFPRTTETFKRGNGCF